jgi:hypothetical protein
VGRRRRGLREVTARVSRLKSGGRAVEGSIVTDDRERAALEWWFRHEPQDHPLIRVLFQIALERHAPPAKPVRAPNAPARTGRR